MKTIPTLAQFTKTFTNGAGRPERRFIEQYGNVSFEEAYPVYVERVTKMFETSAKIRAFEDFLISMGAENTQSNVSESRYYFHGGIKFRFSNHVYPTGSMTSDFCIDLGADPELIHSIKF